MLTDATIDTGIHAFLNNSTSLRPHLCMDKRRLKVTINEHDIKDLTPAGGLKFDQAKPRMDLLDFDALEGLAKVLTFGANKYAAHNWRNGISYSRLTAAMLRHLAAIQRGEDIDAESGLPHIDHLGCCWMFLSNMTKTRPDLDDRYKGTTGNEPNNS